MVTTYMMATSSPPAQHRDPSEFKIPRIITRRLRNAFTTRMMRKLRASRNVLNIRMTPMFRVMPIRAMISSSHEAKMSKESKTFQLKPSLLGSQKARPCARIRIPNSTVKRTENIKFNTRKVMEMPNPGFCISHSISAPISSEFIMISPHDNDSKKLWATIRSAFDLHPPRSSPSSAACDCDPAIKSFCSCCFAVLMRDQAADFLSGTSSSCPALLLKAPTAV
mmetsp:Transcript_95416/g.169393  ORF Transcript_95416/g.169393 Transcript_95416/m.169393 type:complete len:223 (-) Transcript_95416:524-1192(-)